MAETADHSSTESMSRNKMTKEKEGEEPEFEAIRTPRLQHQSRPPNLHAVRSHSSARSQKSYDGYTVDRDDDQAEKSDPAFQDNEFEVRFDGESDPLNPRNRTAFKKWVIVLILAFSSLCVTCASALYTVSGRNR